MLSCCQIECISFMMPKLFSSFVFCSQVLGFEVDSINSVQFSNHTGKIWSFFLQKLVCVYLSAVCGSVWVRQFPRCRDAGVQRDVRHQDSDWVGADPSSPDWVSFPGGQWLRWLAPEQRPNAEEASGGQLHSRFQGWHTSSLSQRISWYGMGEVIYTCTTQHQMSAKMMINERKQ